MYAYNQSLESNLWTVSAPSPQLDLSRRAAHRSALLQALAEQDSSRPRRRLRRPWAWARARVSVAKTA